MESAGLVTIGLFLIGVVYWVGRASARLDAVEQWKQEVKSELHEIRQGIGRLEHLITGEEV